VRVGSTNPLDQLRHGRAQRPPAKGGPQKFASKTFGEGASLRDQGDQAGGPSTTLCTIHPASMNGAIEVGEVTSTSATIENRRLSAPGRATRTRRGPRSGLDAVRVATAGNAPPPPAASRPALHGKARIAPCPSAPGPAPAPIGGGGHHGVRIPSSIAKPPRRWRCPPQRPSTTGTATASRMRADVCRGLRMPMPLPIGEAERPSPAAQPNVDEPPCEGRGRRSCRGRTHEAFVDELPRPGA